MGGLIPKVLRRGGGKKRQKFLIVRTCLFASLAALSILLYFSVPSVKPLLWFIPSGFVFFAIVYCSFIIEDERFNLEFMLFPAILLAGVVQYYDHQWLHYLVIPYITLVALKARTVNAIVICSLLPVINISGYLHDRKEFETLILYILVSLSASVIAMIVRNLRGQYNGGAMSSAGGSAYPIEPMDRPAVPRDESVSHFLTTQLKEDIGTLMITIRSALYADSVSFFEKDGPGKLKLRYSTEPEGSVIITGGGSIVSVLQGKQDLIEEDIKAKRTDVGYIKKDEFDSVAAVCVREGSYSLGVLVIDSDRYTAFNRADLDTLRSFGIIMSNIVKRGKIYQQIRGDLEGLDIIQEESLNILSTLNMNDLCGKIVNAIYRISGEPTVIFIKKGDNSIYRLISAKGLRIDDVRDFDLGDTILSLCIENRQKLALSDTTSLRKRVLPFNAGVISSVLCFPLAYEDDVLGVAVTFSDKKDAFDIYQTHGIEILNNMASLSIDNVNLLHRIEEMALTDGLTGLFNHRHFQERLDEEIKRSDRNMEPLTLILTDIDHFKSVNDNYGHPAGDSVLREVSGIIRSRMRETDIAARYGGEEFALILTNTESRGALKIAEDLRKEVEAKDFTSIDRRVTISLGISEYPSDLSSKQGLIDRADKALYFAKENGRNRSVLWSEVKQ